MRDYIEQRALEIGNYINEPEDHDNHGVDAARYWVLGELLGKIQKPKDLTGIFTH